MNRHQRIAIENVCLLGVETSNQRYHYFDKQISIVLTVNAGYE
jgi:hypothetical protein